MCQRGAVTKDYAGAAAGSASAAKVATVEPSPDAATPQCPHFGACGGCSLQGLQYGAQLAAKQVRLDRNSS